MRIKLLSIMIIGVVFANSAIAQVLTEDKRKDASTTNSVVTSKELNSSVSVQHDDGFKYLTEQFADLRIVRYRIPGWDRLSLNQKKLVYFLTQAGYSGRDIIWDQNYRHNLAIRHALESIITKYNGNKNDRNWEDFMVYTKRVWFSNGIHHHYSMDKIMPEFNRSYFNSLIESAHVRLDPKVIDIMFDPKTDAKKVSLNSNKDLLLASATNFYDPDITEKEAQDFYDNMIDKSDTRPISYGLNSKLVRNEDGTISEKVWKLDGMYGTAIREIIMWLEKAVLVAENPQQAKALKLLIDYYQTGDL
ncbi:MAG: hypothetical protein DRI54_02675, partial [Bacteroidetes bacterium]